MIKLGAALRRKSMEKVQPTLPRPKKPREPSGTGRTIYQELKSPSQQLKQFNKKLPYTMGNLATEHSLSNIRHDQFFSKKHSRFNDDDLNAESIAQLLQSKVQSGFLSTRKQSHQISKANLSKTSNGNNQKNGSSSSNYQSKKSKEIQQKADDDEEGQGKPEQAQNYDDYVLGDQLAAQQEPQDKSQIVRKKYRTDNEKKTLQGYKPQTESEARMQRQHWAKQKKRMMEIHEDQEIIQIMQKYQQNKQQVLNQSKKRHQTASILASVAQNYKKTVEKSLSLPSLKPVREIIIQENVQENKIEKYVQPWKNNNNLLAKQTRNLSTDRIRINDFRLKQSLSYGKLGFGKKKVRTICQQDIAEDEMKQLEEIKSKLRSKGITFDANKLRKGLTNEKHPLTDQVNKCPEKILPSNFIYKKFPL